MFQQGVNSLCRCECLQPGPAAVPSLHAAYPATSKKVNANVGDAQKSDKDDFIWPSRRAAALQSPDGPW